MGRGGSGRRATTGAGLGLDSTLGLATGFAFAGLPAALALPAGLAGGFFGADFFGMAIGVTCLSHSTGENCSARPRKSRPTPRKRSEKNGFRAHISQELSPNP